GTNWRGAYVTRLAEAHGRSHDRAGELSEILRICMLLAQCMYRQHHGSYYTKAQNRRRPLRAEYDRALQRFDLLRLPPCPCRLPPLPAADAPLAERLSPGFEANTTTAPFNLTGHPCLSLPCGMLDGLPVGLSLVGRAYQE